MLVGLLISPLSLSLWWPHGCGFCSGSVLIWIGDRGHGFSFCGCVGVLVLIVGFGSVMGWSVADCHKATEKRCDEDFVGLKCL